MYPQQIRRAAQPLVLLIISSLFAFPSASFSQVDTAKLHKEINQVLKKYGLKDSPFYMKVQVSSSAQKGGQTAYEINNYNGKDIMVFNAPSQFGNNNTQNNINTEPTLNNFQLNEILDSINANMKRFNIKNKYVNFTLAPGSNARKILIQLQDFLDVNGYRSSLGMGFGGRLFKGISINHMGQESIMIDLGEF